MGIAGKAPPRPSCGPIFGARLVALDNRAPPRRSRRAPLSPPCSGASAFLAHDPLNLFCEPGPLLRPSQPGLRVQRANRHRRLSEALFRFPEKALYIYLGHGEGPNTEPKEGHATAAAILSARSGTRFKREASREEAGAGIRPFIHLARARWLSKACPRSIRFAVHVDVQHDPRDLAPVDTFRIRIEMPR